MHACTLPLCAGALLVLWLCASTAVVESHSHEHYAYGQPGADEHLECVKATYKIDRKGRARRVGDLSTVYSQINWCIYAQFSFGNGTRATRQDGVRLLDAYEAKVHELCERIGDAKCRDVKDVAHEFGVEKHSVRIDLCCCNDRDMCNTRDNFATLAPLKY